jgi:flagellar assembly protein FliH
VAKDMKLSSKTGIKKMNAEIKPLMLVEFSDNEEIVQVGARFVDANSDQYTIPKVQMGARSHHDINRFDGHKIFSGKNGLEEIAFQEKEIVVQPVVIKSAKNRGLISEWNLIEFEDESSNYNEDFSNPSKHRDSAGMNRNDSNEISIQESKGLSREIIENAKKEAQLILDTAKLEATVIKETSYREGYQTGFGQVNSEIETLRTIQKNLLQVNEDLIHGSETKIVELLKQITEKLFINGLALDTNFLKDVVARAINEASRLGNLKVYLNPADLDKLRKLWREAELDYNGQKIQLASNNEILPGGCFIDGDYGSVDARINTQIKSVVDTLTEIQMDQVEE